MRARIVTLVGSEADAAPSCHRGRLLVIAADAVVDDGAADIDTSVPAIADPNDAGFRKIGVGSPKDSCAYGAGKNCAGEDSDNTDRLGTGDWDLETYLGVNHNRLITKITGAQLGGIGDFDLAAEGVTSYEEALRRRPDFMTDAQVAGRYDGKITRYIVYQWELGVCGGDCSYGYDKAMYGLVADTNYHLPDNILEDTFGDSGLEAFTTRGGSPDGSQLVPNPLASGGNPPIMPAAPHNREFGGPHEQCYPASTGMGNGPLAPLEMKVDRRMLQLYMVDCSDGFNGKQKFDAEGVVQVFVLTPWTIDGAGAGARHEISVEIIGPTQSELDDGANAEIVVLYE